MLAQKGRSYFLGRLLRDVVINEAQLAARDRGNARRSQYIQIGAWTLAGIAVLGGAYVGWSAIRAENARGERLAAAIARAEASSQGLQLDRIAQNDELARVIPYLRNVRDLPVAAAADGGRLGLNQEEKLVDASELAYKNALDRVLLPRLLARLETADRGGMQRPEFLYEATRVYLMLGRLGPLDRSLVRNGCPSIGTRLSPAPSARLCARNCRATCRRCWRRISSSTRSMARSWTRRDASFRGCPCQRASMHACGPSPISRRRGALPTRWARRDGGGSRSRQASRWPTRRSRVCTRWRDCTGGCCRACRKPSSKPPRKLGARTEAQNAMVSDPRQLENGVLQLYAEEYVRAWQVMLGDIVLSPFRTLPQLPRR